MANERLRGAISSAGFTIDQLADKLGLNPKSVERWITKDRIPHRRHRQAASNLVGVDETYLWPSLADDPRSKTASRAELVEFYPSRSAVPMDLWEGLPKQASERFDFLAYAGLFLPEYVDLVPKLIERAKQGVEVRMLLGDPQGSTVALRGEEEGTLDGLRERIRLCLRYVRDALDVPGFEVRLHDTTLYASIYRADDVCLVNTHVYGSVAAQNPVLHLIRVSDGRVFSHYMKSFEAVWAQGRPLTAGDFRREGNDAR